MMKMMSPDGDITVQLNMIGFVDDSTYVTEGDPSKPVEDLLERIEQDAQ